MQFASRVRAHLASGPYGIAREVIHEALRFLEAHQCVQQSSIAALKADNEQGMVDVRAGNVAAMDMGAVKAQGRALKELS